MCHSSGSSTAMRSSASAPTTSHQALRVRGAAQVVENHRSRSTNRARRPTISMSPTAIGPVKAMLLGLDVGQLTEVLTAALDDDTPGVSVRDLLVRHAEENKIPV